MTDIYVKGLSLERGGKSLFKDFSIDFEAEKVTALIAPSGAGKTSLFDLIAGLLHGDTKAVSFCTQGQENGQGQGGLHGGVCTDRALISYVFQEDRLLRSSTVFQNVLFPLVPLSSPLQNGFHFPPPFLFRGKTEPLFTYAEAKERAALYLEKCGLKDKLHSFPDQLSGGEKQRVSLARAFAYPSRILLMDEAFQSLDLHIKFRLMALFAKLCREEKRTVLLVTHDIREALCLAHRVVVLYGSPLSAVLDEKNEPVLFKGCTADCSADIDETGALKSTYIKLSSEKAALEEKILNLLSE